MEPPDRVKVPKLTITPPPPPEVALLLLMLPPAIVKVPPSSTYTPPPAAAVLPVMLPPVKVKVPPPATYTPPPFLAASEPPVRSPPEEQSHRVRLAPLPTEMCCPFRSSLWSLRQRITSPLTVMDSVPEYSTSPDR